MGWIRSTLGKKALQFPLPHLKGRLVAPPYGRGKGTDIYRVPARVPHNELGSPTCTLP